MIRSMFIAALLVISAQGFAQEKRTIDNRAQEEAKTVVRKGESQERLDRSATQPAEKTQPQTREEAERLRKQETTNAARERREAVSTASPESAEVRERRAQQAERKGLNAGNTNTEKVAAKEKEAQKANVSGNEVNDLRERERSAQKEAKTMLQELDMVVAQAREQVAILSAEVSELAADREGNKEEITRKREKMARLNKLIRQSEEEMARLKRSAN